MGIKNLQFSEPLYTIKFIENQKQYEIGNISIVINLGEKDILIKGRPLGCLKSTIVKNVTLSDIQRALVVEDYVRERNIEALFKETQKQWPLMHDITHLERFTGLPIRRSPKETIDNM